MKRLASAIRILLIPLVIVIYVAILFYNLNERDRRSLRLQKDVPDAEKVHVTVKIMSVDIDRLEVTALLRFRLAGKIATDEITPAMDLKFLVNAVRGQQGFQFRRGERMTPIEAVFSIEGERNKYPFDTYQTDLAFLIMKPGRSGAPAPPLASRGKPGQPKGGAEKQAVTPALAELPATDVLAGAAELEKNAPMPISFDLSASVPGIRFEEDIVKTALDGGTHIQLNLKRANQVITVSMGIQLMMLCLALSVLAMVLFGTIKAEESALVPLSVSVTLIFGLPALRDAQPNVPPLGVFSDYVSYIWAESIVAAATIIAIWVWIFRHHQKKT